MNKLLISLVTIIITVTSCNILKSQELRMSISGIYNGDYNETFEDEEDVNSKFPIYTVDKTCLNIEHLIFKGNYNNVTLKILCGSGGKLLSKSKLNIKGEYKFPMSSVKKGNCNLEKKIVYRITVEDSEGDVIYMCNITGGRDCDVN